MMMNSVKAKRTIKRGVYFLIVLVTVLFVFIQVQAPSKRAAAASIDTSSINNGMGNVSQRNVAVSSNGTILAVIYNTTSNSALVFTSSTDNGTTWRARTTIDNVNVPTSLSVALDGSDNAYVVYSDDANLFYAKLTYSLGNWTVASTGKLVSGVVNSSCIGGGGNLYLYSYLNPTITVDSGGKIWTNIYKHGVNQSSCAVSDSIVTYSSTTGTAWTANAATLSCNGTAPILGVGTGLWMYCSTGIYKDLTSSGTWTQDNATVLTAPVVMASRTTTELDFFYMNASNQLVARTYNTGTASLSAESNISSSVNDVLGQMTARNGIIYVFYQSYVAANSYNVVYKTYNGTAWDINATALTSNNANNTGITSAVSATSTQFIPVLWYSGTVSPYTINEASINYAANSPPSAPTLVAPANGSTGISAMPIFQLRSSDADGDYLRYKIQICSDSACAIIVQKLDQTIDQTGWLNQDQQSGTAYTGSSVLANSTIAMQAMRNSLSTNTTYYWRASAVDPGGTNTLSTASAIQSFTTTANTGNVQINGGTQIKGGSQIQ